MKLNIYEKKKIVKTYTAETYDLMFGTVEDVIGAVDLDEMETGTDAEVIKLVGTLILHSLDTVKDLMKDIFEGLTDEDLRGARVSDMAAVIVEVVMYCLKQLNLGGNEKN